MITLGIETSCDETAAAIVHRKRILSSAISSSVPLHEKYGGVIPEIASRFHVEYINRVTKKALKKARRTLRDVELIAVTEEPGLPGSLLVGMSFAKALSSALDIPLIRVNHLLAHIFANFLIGHKAKISFPFVGVVVSGGHTNIFVCRSFKDIEIIGRTRDDAVGEAFDKVAKIMGIGYPGGPKIERAARLFIGKGIDLPRSYLEKDSFDFSLSGIKTAVLYRTKGRRISGREISRIAWSFQEAVFEVLIERITRACEKFKIDEVLLGGGVISNGRLRTKFERVQRTTGYKFFYPPLSLCLDNAAMVAGLGEELFSNN
ncbi:MAG: tRNA (adenosine(37)-N6)-threonylcarbamoyltransferase complex transferase subunit TsaD [Candidatus Omnitrophota bacterium]